MKQFGWLPNQDELDHVMYGQVSYSETQEQMKRWADEDENDDREVFLWRAITKLAPNLLRDDPLGGTTKRLRSKNQRNLGSCVGFGASSALECTSACDIIHHKQPERWYKTISAGAVYAGSRTVTNQNGRWEGSQNSWAVKFLKEVGTPYEEVYGQYDLRKYSVDQTRNWQVRGLPRELMKQLGHKMLLTYQVKSAKQAWSLIGRGYPLAVASNWGSAQRKRDKNGFLVKSDKWAHQMWCAARRSSVKRGFCIQNSWGLFAESAGSGIYPNDMPIGAFWVSYKDMDWICRTGEVIAYADIDGFKKKELDFDDLFQGFMS